MDRKGTRYKEQEYDSGSDSGSDYSSEKSHTEQLGGPDFINFAKQLTYDKSLYTPTNYHHPYSVKNRISVVNTLVSTDTSIPADTFNLYGNSKFESIRKEVNTLFMIDSVNRDQVVYPQPTNFTLKPPRIYKNVVNIQLSQLKFLTSFYYFNASKGNIMVPVRERGRESINTYNSHSLTKAVIIQEGSYVIGDLLNQLQFELNYTPLFYDFPTTTPFNEFISRFTVSGDLGLNFNQPGDSYYDSLNNKFIQNPTMVTIISYYWPSQYAGLSTYTLSQVQIAYYYPVLYEAVLDTTDTIVYPYLNLTVPLNLSPMLLGESSNNYIIYNFSGLNDPVILYLILQNIVLLDQYRLEHTFRYSLVNRYQLAYDTNSLRVNILSYSLNTSLINLFTTTSSKTTAATLSQLGLTPASYSNIITLVGQTNAVVNDMYNFIQQQLATYFAINFATYSALFFTNANNILYIQNGTDAVGVTSNYTPAYLESGAVPINSSIPTYSNSPGFWPNFNSANSNAYSSILTSEYANNISSSMYPYNITSSNFLYTNKVIDSNYYINTDKTARSINSLITINPARYTIFKFRSPVRQTLQVETLPLPYYYRFADYNKASSFTGVLDQYGRNMPAQYFDLSYAFVYNSSNSLMDSSNYSTISLMPIFGSAYQLSNIYTLNTVKNIHQFEFVAPYPPGLNSNLVAYNTSLAFTSVLSTISTPWVNTVQAYIYHDRGAFMADIQMLQTQAQNSNHYIASNIATTISTDLTINFSTFAGHKYYTIFRSTDPICPINISYSPSIYYPVSSYVEVITDYVNFNPSSDPYSASNLNSYPFVTNYNTDFLRLPVTSSLMGLDPSSSTFTDIITVKQLPIGYDISGVSNDLTDYYGYVPGQKGFIPNSSNYPFCIDPISQYSFKAVSPFDTTLNSYFHSTSSNTLITTSNTQFYKFKGVSTSQTKIVHWYDGYSIPHQISDGPLTNILSSVTSSMSEYFSGQQIYPFDANGNIQFGQGITSIGFIPTDGLYSVDSFTFKSVLYPPSGTTLTSDDPNSKIKYIGVVKGVSLIGAEISISSSLLLLEYTGSVIYSPQTIGTTPGFGVEFGTWYTYQAMNGNKYINGYTQGSNELLSYTSMYYFVPFDANGAHVTFSRLAGSLVPYPLSQVVSTSSTYFGQTVVQPPGASNQSIYIIPSTIAGANPAYGAQGYIAYTQSQYEQSQPITTNSLGYKDYGLLARNENALFNFSTTLNTTKGIVSTGHVGLTTNFTEYANSLYLINSLKYSSTITNTSHTFTGVKYASSISTSIGIYNGTAECIHYLISTPSTLQNYTYIGQSSYFSSFTYQIQPGTNTSTTTLSYQFDVSTTNATIWMWGGGGATWANSATAGGAGAYVKANLNVQLLYQDYGISTIYMVVGKGGNRDNFSNIGNVGQQRYGGGGTSILPAAANLTDGILLQGGGFSGIFMTSTLSSPILLVGGGGAGGATTFGGPGGFGTSQSTLQYYQFSTVTLNTPYFSTIRISTIMDVDSNAFSANYPVASTIDRSLLTYWNPTAAYMNPGNFNATVSTYRVNLQFGSNVSTISKLRLTASSATGLVVYNNINKSQMLYSNTSITYSSNIQWGQYFDATSIPQITNTTLVTQGYIVGGAATPTNMLQYSLDGLNWAQITNVGYSLPANSVMAILYTSALKWFACGQRGKYTTNTWGNLTYPVTTYTPNNGTSLKTFSRSVINPSSHEYPANITTTVVGGDGFAIPSDFPANTSVSISYIIQATTSSIGDTTIQLSINNTYTNPVTNRVTAWNVGNSFNNVGHYTMLFNPGDIISFGFVNLNITSNVSLANLTMTMYFTYVPSHSFSYTTRTLSTSSTYWVTLDTYTVPSNFTGGTLNILLTSSATSSGGSMYFALDYLAYNLHSETGNIIDVTPFNIGSGPGHVIQILVFNWNVNTISNIVMNITASQPIYTPTVSISYTAPITTVTASAPYAYRLLSLNQTYIIPSDFPSGTSLTVTVRSSASQPAASACVFAVNNRRTNGWVYVSPRILGGGNIADVGTSNVSFNSGDILDYYIINGTEYTSDISTTTSNIIMNISFSYTPTPTTVITNTIIPASTDTRVAVSGNGQYQYIASGGLYTSANYGASWVLSSYTSGVYNVSVSGTGQYVALVLIKNNTGMYFVFISSNYGASFPNNPISSGAMITAMSYSGQYILLVIISISIRISSNYGVDFSFTPTFTPSPTYVDWRGGSISESGQYMLATQQSGSVYLSSDFGVTFKSIPFFGTPIVYASAISASGQYMVVSSYSTSTNTTYISSDYGVTWVKPTTPPSGYNFISVTISGSGQYMGLVGQGNYQSYDYGMTWAVSLTAGECRSVSMSADGKYELCSVSVNGNCYLSISPEPNFTTSPILQSSDGLTWTPVTIPGQAQSQGFKTLAFGAGTIVAGGAIGSSGGILSSTDGITWTYRSCSYIVEVSRIRYLSDGKFWGVSVTDFGLINSSDGITWVLVSGTQLFNACDITYGNSVYVVAQAGKDTIGPYVNSLIYSGNTNIWYESSANTNFTAKTVTFGMNKFVTGGYTTDGGPCIKYSTNGSLWLNATLTNTGINLTINEIKFVNGQFMAVGQCPSVPITGRAPNQRSILQSSDGITWNLTMSGGFNSDTGNYAQCVDYGNVQIVPNVSTLYMEIQSASKPYIYEIQALNQSSIGFQTSSNALSTMIDMNLNTSYWPTESQTVGIIDYSFQFNFSTLTNINTLQFYLPSSLISISQQPAYFTGLSIQAGCNVFSNTAITSNQFIQSGSNSLYIASLTSTVRVSSLSIDIFKTTTSSIQISEVKAFYDPNVGLSTMAGYSGGIVTTMAKSYISYEAYEGGGGQFINGGAGGAGVATQGNYLLGGSPTIKAGNQSSATTFSTIINGAGGGGGGYYGGGGGGSTITMGGAGGGGAGYYTPTSSNRPLVTLLDYGTATPLANYIVPGSNEQSNILASNTMTLCNYGQGGLGNLNTGEGQHGLILITCTAPKPVPSPVTVPMFANPHFVDGSRLSVFQASIPGDYDANRILNFSTYTDSIQYTQYSNYNWVWYRSYLSFTGGTLLFPSMTASIQQPRYPSEFSHLPMPVYDSLITVFSNVAMYYSGNTSQSNVDVIVNTMVLSFELLQYYFVNTPYTSPGYVEMTEIYGLLDYLQVRDNLIYPHINGENSSLERLFGGVPRFGYWANPFLTNVSYVGFDITTSLYAPSPLAAMTGSSSPVTAMYGLVLEQSLKTGIYEMKDIMAYKPTVADAGAFSNWLHVTQCTESYIVRNLSNYNILSNIPVQPYSMAAAIEGRLPLFKYSVYTTPTSTGTIPIQMINDFQGANVYLYTFQNTQLDNVSSINMVQIPFTSTMIQINQTNITSFSNSPGNIIGTIVSEYSTGSINQAVTQFGLSNAKPMMNFNMGPNNMYNSYDSSTQLQSGNVGRAINDYNGYLYETDKSGTRIYQNTSTSNIIMTAFKKEPLNTASPKTILANYLANSNANPYYDFFVSKFTNIWHLQGTSNLSTIYGARLMSQLDFTITTNFINQIFYPTHKIILTNRGLSPNPIIDGLELINYPSYPRTEMFYYTNFSSLSTDISYKFAEEKSSNFQYSDTSSGYFLNSYIDNIKMSASSSNITDANSFNYLAIRAYSPSEMFKTLVRFYLPGRYDFGYVSMSDLSNEALIIKTNLNVNPSYSNILNKYNLQFSTTHVFGANSYPGYPGSNIVSGGFGSFLSQYIRLYSIITSNSPIINTVNSNLSQSISNLVNGDLQYILPSYVASRSRSTDPLEFSLPFSTVVSYTNTRCSGNSNMSGQYGLGFNLGYTFADTPYNTIQRATSFFKILDDYIYLKMNPEFNMNRLDISRQEDFSVTHDPSAESQLYNCKLLLNTFGTYSTTFIQNPVVFNPPIGKLDKLSFSWYDSNGNLIDNRECDWTASLQIVERSDIATDDSTAARPQV